MSSETLSFEEFKKLDLRIGKIVSVERVTGSEKLLKLTVDIGDAERQVLAGVGQYYAPEELANRKIVIVANLEPKEMMGFESQGMLLAADTPEGPVLLMPDDARLPEGRETPAGAKIR